MTDRELKIIIKADGSVAIGEIDKLDKTFEGLGGKTEKTQGKLTKLSQAILGTGQSATKSSQEVEKATTTWNEFATGINQAWESLGKVKRVFESGWDMAKQGAQLQEARASFEDYSRSVGRNSDEIISKLKKASGGTIGDLQLITTASKAMSLGVTQDADKMANLLEVARNKARLFGMETTDAFNDIVIGIGRGSPLILDNLGIRIPAGFEEMTKGMTDADKTAKLLELTLIEGNKQLKDMGGITNTTADDIRAMEAAVSNLKLQVGELTASAFGPFVDDLRQEVIPALSDFLKYIKEVSQELGGFNQDTARMFKQQGLAGEFAEKQRLIDEAKLKQTGLDKVLNQTFGSLTSYDQQRFGQNYAGNRNASVEEIRKAIFNESAKIDLEINQLKKELDKTRNKMFVETTFKSTEAELRVDEEAVGILDRLSDSIKKADQEAEEAAERVRRLQAAFAELGRSAINDLESIGDEFDVFADDMDRLLDDFGDGLSDIQKIRQEAAKEAEEAVRNNYRNLKNLDPNTAQWGLMNWASSGYLNAGTDGEPLLKFQSKDKQELQNTIADAVTAGFANADFSSLELTLGSILSSVLSKSVATSNPVVDAATGAVNWGNLGVNLAVNAATKVLTRPGRFFGGREEHGKEAIQQAADLKGRMGQAYVDSFVSEMTSVFAGKAMRDAIANARSGYYGTSIGYTWNDSGNGWTSDRTRTYALADNGASAALKKLTDAVKDAEIFSENREAWINLQAAKGYEYSALKDKVAAYESASSYYGEASLKWTDGSVNQGENLTKLTYEIQSTLAEMVRELGAATAERFTAAASGFSKYAPWLQNFVMAPAQLTQNGVGGTAGMYDSFDYYLNPASGMSRDQQYDAFEKLQNDYADRNINGGLLQMIKESGSGRYELEKLRVTGSEDYAEAYADYLDKQISAIEEVMERQEEIFKDATRTFEEQSAALANYEAAQDSYYQAKLDSLAAEQAAEEAIKQKQQEADLRKAERMEAALSLVGEVAQRGDKIVILRGGDSTVALKELLEKFSDDPEVSAILQAEITKNEAKARWGN